MEQEEEEAAEGDLAAKPQKLQKSKQGHAAGERQGERERIIFSESFL